MRRRFTTLACALAASLAAGFCAPALAQTQLRMTWYSDGNEGEVGRALAESGVPRDEVFVTTKCPPSKAGHELDTLKGKLTAGDIRDAVVTANPEVPRDAIFVGTAKKQWLTEVRLCLNVSYRAMPCEGGKIGAADKVPVRVRPR